MFCFCLKVVLLLLHFAVSDLFLSLTDFCDDYFYTSNFCTYYLNIYVFLKLLTFE